MDVRRRGEDVALHVDVDSTMRGTRQVNECDAIAAELRFDASLWLGRACDVSRVVADGALATIAELPRLLLWYAIIGIGTGAYVDAARTFGLERSVAVDVSLADLHDLVATAVPSLLFQSAVVVVMRQAMGGNALGRRSRLGTALAEVLPTRLPIRSEVDT